MPQAIRTPWFTFVTQNVQANPLMTQTHVIEDVERTNQDGDFWAMQEIFPERYEDAVRCLNSPTVRAWVPEDPNGGVALGWPKREWALLDRGKVLLHEGKKKVSEDRYLVWALLRHIKTGALLLTYSFHFVAGAWNDRKTQPGEEFRPGMWDQDREVTREFLKEWVQKGIPTMGGGDGNRRHSHPDGPLLGERIARRKIYYVAEPMSIDPMMFTHGVEWRWIFDKEGAQTLSNRHSDHDGRLSRQRLVHRKPVTR